MAATPSDTREQILQAALKRFAEKGYAGTSVQEIVDAARVTKPALYYHFRNKADLYRALVDRAFEERRHLMEAAAARAETLAECLTEVTAAVFEYVDRNRELMRLSFATAFAAPGEVPPEAKCLEKGWRNFEFVEALLRQAAARGELDRRFDLRELALGFCGLVHLRVMVHLLKPAGPLDRRTARRVVELFLNGAKSR